MDVWMRLAPCAFPSVFTVVLYTVAIAAGRLLLFLIFCLLLLLLLLLLLFVLLISLPLLVMRFGG